MWWQFGNLAICWDVFLGGLQYWTLWWYVLGDNMLDGSRCGDNLADGWIACGPEITYPHRCHCRANYPKTTSSVLSKYFSYLSYLQLSRSSVTVSGVSCLLSLPVCVIGVDSLSEPAFNLATCLNLPKWVIGYRPPCLTHLVGQCWLVFCPCLFSEL